jgi:hypothetical protein
MKLIFKGTAYLPEYRGLHDGKMVHVPAGGQVEVSDEAAAVLIRDFTGIFVAARGLEAPPADKMIRKAPFKKRL